MMTKNPQRSTASIPRRDWIVLPALAILTPFLLMQITDRALRGRYTTTNESLGKCLDYAHARAGIPAIPNCEVLDKRYETPTILYQFNSCGMRSVTGCHTSKPGSYRIALLGSSIAFGQYVQFDDSIAHQLEIDVDHSTGQKIEVANYGRMDEYPHFAVRLLPDVLQRKPALVVLAVSTYDISVSETGKDPDREMQITRNTQENHLRWWTDYLRYLLTTSSPSELADTLQAHLKNRIEGSRAAMLLLGFEYQNKQRYIRQYLKGQDSEVGYLQVRPSATWERDYQGFGSYMQQMTAVTHRAGIPFVVVLLPTRAQVAMLNSGSWPVGYDPYLIDEKVKTIVESSGGIFLDIFPDCAKIPNLESHYFIQNGHPDGVAHTLFARLIARQLTGGVVPALRAQGTTAEVR